MRNLNFSWEVLVAFIDAGLLLTERCFEVQVLIDYHKSEEVWWFSLTLLFIWLPGVIFVGTSVILATKFGCNANITREGFKYGPLFPFTSVIRRFKVAFEGLVRGDYVIKAAFNDDAAVKSYQACFDNAPQISLQIHTIMLQWEGNMGKSKVLNYHYNNHKSMSPEGSNNAHKVGLIIPSLLELSKVFSDTHFYRLVHLAKESFLLTLKV